MNFLIVVDMQNDFITGSLGSKDAEKIVPKIRKRLEEFDGEVIFTKDTHFGDYLKTQEGQKLPVEHCIKGTGGHEICPELLTYAKRTVEKNTFASLELPKMISDICENPDTIELCGLCTDICVISNAMLLKAAFPESKTVVDEKLCAGVTPESHACALNAMRAVQIDIV